MTQIQAVKKALGKRWRTTPDLAERAGVSRDQVSRALYKLRQAGLAERRDDGRHRRAV